MKYREILLDQLKFQPYFDKKAMRQLSQQYGLKGTTLDTYIHRSLRRKEIISLKKGLYVHADFYEKNKGNISYLFYLANILRAPSYVSSWAALQYYNLTTESIHAITSVTTKVTRSYKTRISFFLYQSIREELFSGFLSAKGESISSVGRFDFFIASPAKALFDLLYFKTNEFRGMELKDIKEYIADIRIDFEEMNPEEREKFYSMIKKYLCHE